MTLCMLLRLFCVFLQIWVSIFPMGIWRGVDDRL